jgi:hypothetical protein
LDQYTYSVYRLCGLIHVRDAECRDCPGSTVFPGSDHRGGSIFPPYQTIKLSLQPHMGHPLTRPRSHGCRRKGILCVVRGCLPPHHLDGHADLHWQVGMLGSFYVWLVGTGKTKIEHDFELPSPPGASAPGFALGMRRALDSAPGPSSPSRCLMSGPAENTA